ncbi:NUDIX domain-containing protein [Spirochaetia bacterium 38H-sp]|uniref:NUDIX domain-containing protein n=1 Tax=Rarispira pelagica TaxID=3141764 RepID=A0ABU9UA00_9SPIR
MPDTEKCVLVDEYDRVLGEVDRSLCHKDPSLIHRTSHVVVIDRDDRLLLQKRSLSKDMEPGKWDTAVGGHLSPGENYEDAAMREYAEELGHFPPVPLKKLFDMRVRTDRESENVRVFLCTDNGPFSPDKKEISELRFFSSSELASLEKEDMTPGLAIELKLLEEKGIILIKRRDL